MLEHLNEEHADTVLMLAAFAGERREAVAAELVRVDRSALRMRVRRADGSEVESTLPFSGPTNSRSAIRPQLFELLIAARSLAGDATPLTSLEREIANSARLSTPLVSAPADHPLASARRRRDRTSCHRLDSR